jgi:hypothetical protein
MVALCAKPFHLRDKLTRYFSKERRKKGNDTKGQRKGKKGVKDEDAKLFPVIFQGVVLSSI